MFHIFVRLKKRWRFALRGKCLNPEFFWSVISRIRTKERDLLFILYLVRIQKNTDHKNSEIVQFSRSFVGVTCKFSYFFLSQ